MASYYGYRSYTPKPQPTVQRQEYATLQDFEALADSLQTRDENIKNLGDRIGIVQEDVYRIRGEQDWIINEAFGNNDSIRTNLEYLENRVSRLEMTRATVPMKRLRVTVRAGKNIVRIRK